MDAWGRMGMHGDFWAFTREAAVFWVSHTPTFFKKMQDYAEAVVFVFRVDSEGASSVEVCARVCVCVLENLFFFNNTV